MTKEIRTALIGLGNVGRSFLTILESKQGRLAEQYGLAFRIVCVADSSGVAVNPGGYEPGATRRAKENGVPVRRLAGYWPGFTPGDALAADLECDLVLEASPVNLKSGEPGLSAVRMALMRGVSVVLANKGPLVLAFPEVKRLARERRGPGLQRYGVRRCPWSTSARDLIAADIQALAASSTARPTSSWVRWPRASLCRRLSRGATPRASRDRSFSRRGGVGYGQQTGDHRQHLLGRGGDVGGRGGAGHHRPCRGGPAGGASPQGSAM